MLYPMDMKTKIMDLWDPKALGKVADLIAVLTGVALWVFSGHF